MTCNKQINTLLSKLGVNGQQSMLSPQQVATALDSLESIPAGLTPVETMKGLQHSSSSERLQ